jgi:glucose-6-phosphate isomerase
MTKKALWKRFKQYYYSNSSLGLAVDISRMNFSSKFFENMKIQAENAFKAMDKLEAGAIANPDEKRMVGHYWLRDSSKAPDREIKNAINTCLRKIKKFAADVHSGSIVGQKGKKFKNLLVVGIGGSALGPQFVTKALGSTKDKMTVYFFDNTDPDGMDKALQQIGRLDQTLAIVISKSGGTKETRNGMVEAQNAYEQAGLNFGKHAVAVTQKGSLLDQYASKNKFRARFPMWDWVGGRTSELSAVGLLPAALEGLDIQAMLDGAKAMDEATRVHDIMQNPAMLLALMWYHAGKGKGMKDMVILPYKDRLELFSKSSNWSWNHLARKRI